MMTTVSQNEQFEFGLTEQTGSHVGEVTRAKFMSEQEAEAINAKIDVIKWVRL